MTRSAATRRFIAACCAVATYLVAPHSLDGDEAQSRAELEFRLIGNYIDAQTPDELRSEAEAAVAKLSRELSPEQRTKLFESAVEEALREREEGQVKEILSLRPNGELWGFFHPPRNSRGVWRRHWSLERFNDAWHIAWESGRQKFKSRIVSITDEELLIEAKAGYKKYNRRFHRLQELPDWAAKLEAETVAALAADKVESEATDLD